MWRSKISVAWPWLITLPLVFWLAVTVHTGSAPRWFTGFLLADGPARAFLLVAGFSIILLVLALPAALLLRSADREE